jgi:hypothetical protein
VAADHDKADTLSLKEPLWPQKTSAAMADRANLS